MDDTRPVAAKDVVENPDAVFRWHNQYVIIKDGSMTGTFTNLIEAMNLCAERGWETVSIATDQAYMYALVRDTMRKRKNDEI